MAPQAAVGRGPMPVVDGNLRKADENEVVVMKFPDGREHRLKILRPQVGSEMFLDIRDLYEKTGCFTFDPGYACTASCVSAITYIDGPAGICLYRGYPIQDLCERASALEVAHLLLVGELPDEVEKAHFAAEVKKHMLVHDKIKSMFASFTGNAHPMAIMVAVVGGLSTVFSETDASVPANRWLACTRLIAKVPVLAAISYRTSIGQPVMYPKHNLSYAENFLYMMFATPLEDYVPHPSVVKAVEGFMILHMDHEQSALTPNVRRTAPSQANPYACIAAGIASLWGPAHGGANEAVIKMLEEIGSKEAVPQFLADVKAKKGTRLMGFGHRVYQSWDPRAIVAKRLVEEVIAELGVKDPLLETAKALEEACLQDDYFVTRKLYPNVDYFSGILLRAIGIPTSMFTVMFAMSRTVGWVSQWNEICSEGLLRITRPRQLYCGTQRREYAPSPGTAIRQHAAPHASGYPGEGLQHDPKTPRKVAALSGRRSGGGGGGGAWRKASDGYASRKTSAFKMTIPEHGA